ncbi:DUF4386 domain-containing protein [Paenibacillus sp.]|uniref:DUF4386 domain-containing protein n=1 Tax=Paenibacillus sp. TaxID=58172 RepID=UPI002D64558B|nr:DUF4386 domain-containing protein [Paenibacillus sp.]HZG84819.1 DUF4386 domain-containing protein [Paenibacillus sp.]
MTNLGNNPSTARGAAVAGGVSLLLMAAAAAFAYGFVHQSLIVPGDSAATLDNLLASPALFRAGIFGWLVILICDIVAAWAVYLVLKPAHAGISLLGAWFRIGYAAILGAALLNLLVVSLLATPSAETPLLPLEQAQALTALLLAAFESSWSAGLIVFGAHLLLVSYLTFRLPAVPKWLSALLLLAAVGYLSIHSLQTLFPHNEGFIAILEYVFLVPMTAGELGFGIWLLWKGGKGPKPEESRLTGLGGRAGDAS